MSHLDEMYTGIVNLSHCKPNIYVLHIVSQTCILHIEGQICITTLPWTLLEVMMVSLPDSGRILFVTVYDECFKCNYQISNEFLTIDYNQLFPKICKRFSKGWILQMINYLHAFESSVHERVTLVSHSPVENIWISFLERVMLRFVMTSASITYPGIRPTTFSFLSSKLLRIHDTMPRSW